MDPPQAENISRMAELILDIAMQCQGSNPSLTFT